MLQETKGQGGPANRVDAAEWAGIIANCLARGSCAFFVWQGSLDPRSTSNALQIRVTLSEIEPAVWRRFVVPWIWASGAVIEQPRRGFQRIGPGAHLIRQGAVRVRIKDPGKLRPDRVATL
jgi:hypothetical protein